MDRQSEQVLEIATVMVIILTVLCAMYYLIIGFNPQSILNPFPPPPTTTPTLPVPPTFPPTWTPTVTNTPTWTPLPTDTPTSTPTPTDTPTMTPIPTDTPTVTPTPPPTETPTPTATPMPPTFTPSPTPMPYTVQGRPNGVPKCGYLGVKGYVWDRDRFPVPGVMVRVWADGWCCSWGTTGGTGEYEAYLDDHAKAGRWFAAVWENGVAVSPVVTFETDANCQTGRQLIWINWTKNY